MNPNWNFLLKSSCSLLHVVFLMCSSSTSTAHNAHCHFWDKTCILLCSLHLFSRCSFCPSFSLQQSGRLSYTVVTSNPQISVAQRSFSIIYMLLKGQVGGTSILWHPNSEPQGEGGIVNIPPITMKWKRREMTHTLVFGDFSWNTHMPFPLHLHWRKKVAWPCLSVGRWESTIRCVPGRRPGNIWWTALMTVTNTRRIPTTPCSWPADINPSCKVLGFLIWTHMAHGILLRGTRLWGGMRVVTSTGLK